MPASRARTATCSAPLEWPSRPVDRGLVAGGAPSLQIGDLVLLHFRRDGDDRTLSGRQRRRLGLDELVDADNGPLAQLDLVDTARIALDELRLET